MKTDCKACDAKYYCQFKGTTAQTTEILAGYYNLEPGQTRPDPNKCPIYAYCPAGSDRPTPCPNGRWTPWPGAVSVADCIPCERGHFCRFVDMYSEKKAKLTTAARYADPARALSGEFAKYHGFCRPGYICIEGSSTSTPAIKDVDIDQDTALLTAPYTGGPCPKGHYCDGNAIRGASVPVPCDFGTNSNAL